LFNRQMASADDVAAAQVAISILDTGALADGAGRRGIRRNDNRAGRGLHPGVMLRKATGDAADARTDDGADRAADDGSGHSPGRYAGRSPFLGRGKVRNSKKDSRRGKNNNLTHNVTLIHKVF
jgi:hypothetical protein